MKFKGGKVEETTYLESENIQVGIMQC